MFSDRVFQIALLISLVAHGVIVFLNAGPFFHPEADQEKKIEVSYLKQPPQEKEAQVRRQMMLKPEPFMKLPEKITVDQKAPPAFPGEKRPFKMDKSMLSSSNSFNKPTLVKPDLISIKKKITLPPIDMDKSKINNPSYVSYYQLVREKIRRSAYQNYTRTEIGEAYLSFIISKEGSLEDAHVLEEKSDPNPYLQAIALKSVRESAPFPAFPKDLDYPRLSFNVVISFEVE